MALRVAASSVELVTSSALWSRSAKLTLSATAASQSTDVAATDLSANKSPNRSRICARLRQLARLIAQLLLEIVELRGELRLVHEMRASTTWPRPLRHHDDAQLELGLG